ncbi:hypothetical protein [Brachyspira pilosicoli]|nr:hypothetical protein [Brachyspira pilosicoli]
MKKDYSTEFKLFIVDEALETKNIGAVLDNLNLLKLKYETQ